MLPSRIETISVDTAALPASQQFEEWARNSHNTATTALSRGAFTVRGSFWNLGPVVVTRAEIDPFVAERTRRLIAATGTDHLVAVVIEEGETLFEADGIDHLCRPDEVFICDYALPSRVVLSRQRYVSAYVARDFIEEVTGPIRAQGPLRPSAEATLFAIKLKSLVRHLPDCTREAGGLYARVLRDLLAACLLPQFGSSNGRDRAALRERAKAYIVAQPPGTLSVDALARSLGVRRSTVYEAFRQDGGILAYDRLRRLRLLHRDVALGGRRRPIAEIGLLHGFEDASTLARAFRSAFGVSPSDVRDGRRPSGDGADAVGMGRFSRAVEKLRLS